MEKTTAKTTAETRTIRDQIEADNTNDNRVLNNSATIVYVVVRVGTGRHLGMDDFVCNY